MGETGRETPPPMEEEEELPDSYFFSKPMFEVFRISIHPKKINLPEPNTSLDGNQCEIHGIVRVVNEDGKVFEFYNRTTTNPETLIPGDHISLCAFPIMPYKLLKVVVMLYDVAHNVEIANGYFQLDYCKTYKYDEVHTEHVEGEYGFASVSYSTFQHAVIASVKVVLHNEAAGSSLGDNLLFGTVGARLERKFRKSGGNVDDEFPLVTLFHNQRKAEESSAEQSEFNTPINLFRSCVVVPFYCSLKIEAKFHDKNDTEIVMAIQLNDTRLNDKTFRNQNCEMHVEVTWLDCYGRFPWEESQKLSSGAQQSLLYLSSRWSRVSQPMLPSFAEVFSVLICAPDADLALHGTVEIQDLRGSFYIFKGEERCHGQKSLPIVGLPHSIKADIFCVKVNMKDREGRVVSQGVFHWNDLDDNSFYLDKRICSIIEGDIGYAAIQYSMFEYSLKAITRVSFLSKTIPLAFVNVSGSIIAEYGNCEYATPYDQQYYKSTLFSRDDYVRVDLISGSQLPLAKPVISVPLDNSLILDLNLRVMGPCVNQEEEKVDDMDKQDLELTVINKLVEFKFNVDGYFVYNGPDYIISMCVEWIIENTKDITRPILPHKTWLQKVLQKASTTG